MAGASLARRRGEIGGVLISSEDITERKLNEQALRDSLKEIEDLKAALDEHAIVAVTDARGVITFGQRQVLRHFPIFPRGIAGPEPPHHQFRHHPPEFFATCGGPFARGKVWHGELCNRARDGSLYWVDTTIVPFLDEGGKPRQFVAIRTDVTARKQAEEALRKSEALLAAVFEQMPVAIGVSDARGRFVLKNARSEFYAGSTVPSMDDGAYGRWHIRDAEGKRVGRDQYPTARALRGEMDAFAEALYEAPDGAEVWTHVAATPLRNDEGAVTGAIVIVTDIDKTKRGEIALRESEEHLMRKPLSQTIREQVQYEGMEELEPVTSMSMAQQTDNIESRLAAAAQPLDFSAPLEVKFASYDNYCSLFHFILNSDGPVDLEPPSVRTQQTPK